MAEKERTDEGGRGIREGIGEEDYREGAYFKY